MGPLNYVGKKDIVSGETITPHKAKRAEQVQDYGHIYLVKHISKQIGLEECINLNSAVEVIQLIKFL